MRKLLDYCRRNNWAGFDPYDALNSRLFAKTPFSRSRICRIALTQIMKRLPVNLRPFMLIKKEQNPKALGLFLMALVKLQKIGLLGQEDLVREIIDYLCALKSPDTAYWCWGYSFPWQTRTNLVPRSAPNLVCTTFVAGALLDAYEYDHEARCLDIATSAAEYILDKLYWEEGPSVAGFSYPVPGLRSPVHNANFLGAALLCRLYRHIGEKRFLEPALRAARYSAARQRLDGSWDYGELPTQNWVDNFHTGYNLCALQTVGRCAGTLEFDENVRRGLEFYRDHFFTREGAPKYFHDRTYPVDVHSVAQSIITMLELRDVDKSNVNLADSVLTWAMNNMWDEKGYFYYQVLPFFTNKVSYMRWSQAWMLLALSMLMEQNGH